MRSPHEPAAITDRPGPICGPRLKCPGRSRHGPDVGTQAKQPFGVSYVLALFSSRLCGYMPCADAFSLAIAFRIRLRGAPVSWIRFGLRYRPAISRGSLAAVAPAVHTNFPGIPGLLIFEPVYSRIVAGAASRRSSHTPVSSSRSIPSCRLTSQLRLQGVPAV
jgi:hypothetical protein